MGISKQIGWSPEANLYYQISQQLDRLIGVTSKVVLGPPTPPPPIIPTVTIGSQKWTVENLNVDRYRNGDLIQEVQDATLWANLTTGAWCWYNNNSSNGPTYGRLYNWYALNDARGLAPLGYHIPTDAEWTTLVTYLGGSSLAGGAMKSTTGWAAPNSGATNSSGFTGLPGGLRGTPFGIGSFNQINFQAHWWSSTENNILTGKSRAVFYNTPSITSSNVNKTSGCSVRLIKN